MKKLYKEFQIKIADLVFHAVSKTQKIKLVVSQDIEPFLVSRGTSDIVVQVHLGSIVHNELYEEIFRAQHGLCEDQNFITDSLWRIYRVNGSYMVLTSSPELDEFPHVRAIFDFGCKVWDLYIPKHRYISPTITIDPFEYPLGPLIMLNTICSNHGALVHACGVNDNDQGLLFCGFSSAGKSTMAKIWMKKGATILNDDRIIIRKVGSKFFMYNTPMYSTFSPNKVPLSKIFFIKHFPSNQIIALTRSEAAARLFSCCFPPFYSETGIASLLNVFSEIIETVPIYEFGFVPNEDIVNFVRNVR